MRDLETGCVSVSSSHTTPVTSSDGGDQLCAESWHGKHEVGKHKEGSSSIVPRLFSVASNFASCVSRPFDVKLFIFFTHPNITTPFNIIVQRNACRQTLTKML